MTDPDDFWHIDDRRSRTDLIVLAAAIIISGGLVAAVLFAAWKLLA